MDIKHTQFGDGFLYLIGDDFIIRKNMKLNTAWEEVEFPKEFVAVSDQKDAIEKDNFKTTSIEKAGKQVDSPAEEVTIEENNDLSEDPKF